MKKWLIGCLTVLAMVCLIPGIVLKAAAETVPVRCPFCGISVEREVRRYEKYDSTYHKVCVDACQNCHKDGNVAYIQVHTGGTGTFTCTTGKTCEKCGAEYGVLGHDWGAWTPNYASNGTHTRRCKRSNCDAEETGSCSGGYATCDTLGMCNTCGGSYYGGHAWGEWKPNGNGTHTRSCMRTTAPKLILQAVPVAKQPAAPKRSAWSVVGNTAKKTQITMIWCISVQKPPPVRKSAGTLTTAASAAAIPPAKSCPHSMI